MDISSATTILSALGQETRLQVYRLLVEFGSDGAHAGELSQALEIPHNTLSFHLSHLTRAGLVESEKNGRNVRYQCKFSTMDSLMEYLTANCCSRQKNQEACC